MDIAATGQAAPATDDQELAKVLESMNSTLTTAHAGTVTAPDEPADTDPSDDGLQFEMAPIQAPVVTTVPPVVPEPQVVSTYAPTADDNLEAIKKDALTELRPLVDKLNLPPEEKFNTLLLIIRSTDDKTLVPQDTRRAEALLDIIKEIDYFSRPAQ